MLVMVTFPVFTGTEVAVGDSVGVIVGIWVGSGVGVNVGIAVGDSCLITNGKNNEGLDI